MIKMHYKGYLITDKLPTKDVIKEKLQKYHIDYTIKKPFEYDYYEIGGRFGGKIKIKFNPEENEDDYYLSRHRNNKYFISNMLNILRYHDELELLMYMGLRDNILYVDGGYYEDIIDFKLDDCCVVITENKIILSEFWDGNHWINNEKQFNKEIAKLSLNSKFITVIDFHW
jgi:hypothetical protein